METNIGTAIRIRHLSINVNGFSGEDSNGLVQLVLKLSNLQNIELFNICPSYFRIINGINNYINKYESVLQLKNLSLDTGKLINRNAIFHIKGKIVRVRSIFI